MRPKKFFYDIRLLSQKEAKRREFELKNHQKNKVRAKKPLVFDALIPEDRIQKNVSRLWQKGRLVRNRKRLKTIGEAAESVCGRADTYVIPYKRLRAKTFFKNSLILFLKLSFVALMVYNAFSLYFEKDWLSEKINNLALASKAHLALAQESISTLDRDKSSEELEKAGIHLLAIKQELLKRGEYNYLLPNHPMLSNQLTAGQNMLEIGLLLKDTNTDINLLIDSITQDGPDESLALKSARLKAVLERISHRVERADIILKTDPKVKSALGGDLGQKVEKIIDQSKIELEKAEKVLGVMPLILGKDGNNKYLVFFENNAEMRPGGGFPGNYGIISFKDSKLEKIKIDNVYNLDRLIRSKIDTIEKNEENPVLGSDLPTDLYLPKPIEELSLYGYWKLFSSNWSLDFRDNAKRAIYQYNNFYPAENDVGGLIVLTPNIIEEILGIVGPIKMDGYGVEINKDNFREIIEFKVEVDNPYKAEGRWDINPKQILADFGPMLLDKISQSDLQKKIKIFEAMVKNAQEKQILLYHQDPQVQSIISDLGVSGEILETGGDSLGIFETNTNAAKNGQVIETRAVLKSEVSALGFTTDELSLAIVNNESNPRFLHGREEGYFEIVTPLGSRIREAKIDGQDFIGTLDYFEEAGHTIFGFRMILEPGEAKNVVLRYQAPLKNYTESGYSLNLFKQAGAKLIEFKGEINFEDTAKYGSEQRVIRESIDADKTIRF